MVTLIIGSGPDPLTLYIQEAILVTGSKVSSAAIRNEHLGGGEKGVLRFPEDDHKAWELLAYWIVERKLPSIQTGGALSDAERKGCQALLVENWILGDKYDIPRLQDLVMPELLDLFSRYWDFDAQVMDRAVKGSAPGSKLRLVAAREAVYHFV